MRTGLPTLTLRPRHLTPRQARALPWVTALVMLAPLAVSLLFLYVLPAPHPRTADEFFSAWLELISHAWTGNWGNALQLGAIYVVLGIQLWYWRQADKRERLVLDGNGIRYHSPFPGSLARFKPDWSLQWSEIRSIRLEAPRLGGAPAPAALVLETPSGKKRLMPLQWSDVDAPPPQEPRLKLTFVRTLPKVDDSPLIRYFATAGIPVERTDAAGFALEKNQRSLAVTVAFFALIGYGLIDFTVMEEAYAGRPLMEIYIIAGLATALASVAWMRRGMVPLPESIMIGVLLGGACGAALYPGLLRLNQLTDSSGPQNVEYHASSTGKFTPLRQDLPVLEFDDNADYWAQFPAGATYRFQLRRGGLGFYQLDLAAIHGDMRHYYDGKRGTGAAGNRGRHKA